jgi:hypothetical protein
MPATRAWLGKQTHIYKPGISAAESSGMFSTSRQDANSQRTRFQSTFEKSGSSGTYGDTRGVFSRPAGPAHYCQTVTVIPPGSTVSTST